MAASFTNGPRNKSIKYTGEQDQLSSRVVEWIDDSSLKLVLLYI